MKVQFFLSCLLPTRQGAGVVFYQNKLWSIYSHLGHVYFFKEIKIEATP